MILQSMLLLASLTPGSPPPVLSRAHALERHFSDEAESRDRLRFFSKLNSPANLAQMVAPKWTGIDCDDEPVVTIPEPGPTRIVVTLERVPPSRLRCAFTSDQGQAELVWEPLESATLSRWITLDHGPWIMSCQGDRLESARAPGVDFAWWSDSRAQQQGCQVLDQEGLILYHLVPAAAPGEFRRSVTVVHVKRADPLGIDALLGSLGQRMGGAAGGSSLEGRAFGALPATGADLAADLFQTIAEVAVERARDKGMGVLETKLRELVCEDLLDKYKQPPTATTFASARASTSDPPLFARTCSILASVRLQDLAANPTALMNALRQDVVSLAFNVVRRELSRTHRRDADLQLGVLDVPLGAIEDALTAQVSFR